MHFGMEFTSISYWTAEQCRLITKGHPRAINFVSKTSHQHVLMTSLKYEILDPYSKKPIISSQMTDVFDYILFNKKIDFFFVLSYSTLSKFA